MQSTGRSSTMVDSRTLVLSPIVNGRLTRPATGKGSPEALVRVKFEGSIFVLLNLQIGDVLSDSKVFWLPLSKSALTVRPKSEIFRKGRLSVKTVRTDVGFRSGLYRSSLSGICSYPSANRISSMLFNAPSLCRSPSGAQSFLHRTGTDVWGSL